MASTRPTVKNILIAARLVNFRAHIRRSTDLSRTAEGLLVFSETKNKEALQGRPWGGWELGWMHRVG